VLAVQCAHSLAHLSTLLQVDVSAHGNARLINLVPDEVLNVQADNYSLQDIQFNLVHPDEEHGSCSMQAANSYVGYNALVKDVVEKASTHRYGTSTNGSVVIQVGIRIWSMYFSVLTSILNIMSLSIWRCAYR
jgi:hypothetical protein